MARQGGRLRDPGPGGCSDPLGERVVLECGRTAAVRDGSTAHRPRLPIALLGALLIAGGPGEWRAALLEDGVPVELFIERGDQSEAGSIHLGRVRRLLPALGAMLVDIRGGETLSQAERAKLSGIAGEDAAGLRLLQPEPIDTLIADAMGLNQRWRDILDRAARLSPPARLDPPRSFAAALTGALPGAPSRILVDDPGIVPELRAVFPDTMMQYKPEAEWPLELDAVFDRALAGTVALAGGGSIHIEATRAAVLIDVDSGIPETGSPECTGLAVNLAAVDAIAGQIRLRNLGGGIVIDFVGLEDRRLRERVRDALARALKPDPARPQILGWTRLGHFELVRPRRGRPLAEALLEPRSGGPLVKTAVTVAHGALRALRREARAQPGCRWHLSCNPDVA